MSGRPNSLRNDPGYWLVAAFCILFPPMWLLMLGYFLWELPSILRTRRLVRECAARGGHLWGEYHDHPYWDIPHQFCTHCNLHNPESFPPPRTALQIPEKQV